jgi:hypothetical protein
MTRGFDCLLAIASSLRACKAVDVMSVVGCMISRLSLSEPNEKRDLCAAKAAPLMAGSLPNMTTPFIDHSRRMWNFRYDRPLLTAVLAP